MRSSSMPLPVTTPAGASNLPREQATAEKRALCDPRLSCPVTTAPEPPVTEETLDYFINPHPHDITLP